MGHMIAIRGENGEVALKYFARAQRDIASFCSVRQLRLLQ